MKYIISIALVVIYLGGIIQPSWFLIDFYLNRDDITQKYCVNLLDYGITTCRASCYLENLKKEKTREPDSRIIAPEKIKSAEMSGTFKAEAPEPEKTNTSQGYFYNKVLLTKYSGAVFHPPKWAPSLNS